jgi:hypothetical protein
MLRLVGTDTKFAKGDQDGTLGRNLPHPLPAGAEPRLAEDGSLLHNPVWKEGIGNKVNKAYLEASIKLIHLNNQARTV